MFYLNYHPIEHALLLMTYAVLNPSSERPTDALSPAPPAPTTMASNVWSMIGYDCPLVAKLLEVTVAPVPLSKLFKADAVQRLHAIFTAPKQLDRM